VAKRISAGILLYRVRGAALEVFLVHPGGPYWHRKDQGAWSIPKGEVDNDVELLAAAQREFYEETGARVSGELLSLTPLKQPGGKVVHAWAVRGDIDPRSIVSNSFSMEWPPRSGKTQDFPEVDRGEWFTIEAAREKILRGQQGFLDELEELVALTGPAGASRPHPTKPP
jgi:predicted NUDIX family NTP pyrophosphohydrolase